MKVSILFLLTLALPLSAFGQASAPSPTPSPSIVASSTRYIPNEIEKMDARVNQVVAKAEDHFRKGKLDLYDDKRREARDEFDKAVNTVLESGVDVRSSQRLQTFYLELVEKIYRVEVPLQALQNGSIVARNSRKRANQEVDPSIGFHKQKFDPSPLDDLAKAPSTDPSPTRSDSIVPTGALSQNAKVTSLCPTEPLEIGGLHLGMTFEVAGQLFENLGAPEDPDTHVLRTTVFGFDRRNVSAASERRSSASVLDLVFTDKILTSIAANYGGSIRWSSGEQFFDVLRESLRLPEWQRVGNDERMLTCSGFTLLAKYNFGSSPTVTVFDPNAIITAATRKAEAEKRRQESFKP